METTKQGEGKSVVVIMTVLFLCFTMASVALLMKQHAAQRLSMRSQVMAAAPQIVIGPHQDFLGSTTSPYTLVEFGDYQCPPCRTANKEIPNLLKRYAGTLRLTFRNLPLTSIHPFAQSAAVAAEAARRQGQFWQVHDDLYQNDLSSEMIADLPAKHHLNLSRFRQASRTEAEATVRSDSLLAQKLGLNSTPTFILCRPDGKVIHLANLNQLPDAMRYGT